MDAVVDVETPSFTHRHVAPPSVDD
jgi:hypothetical protein